MVPLSILQLGLATDSNGDIVLNSNWPPGSPPNFTFYFQYWWADAGGVQGFSSSNASGGTTP